MPRYYNHQELVARANLYRVNSRAQTYRAKEYIPSTHLKKKSACNWPLDIDGFFGPVTSLASSAAAAPGLFAGQPRLWPTGVGPGGVRVADQSPEKDAFFLDLSNISFEVLLTAVGHRVVSWKEIGLFRIPHCVMKTTLQEALQKHQQESMELTVTAIFERQAYQILTSSYKSWPKVILMRKGTLGTNLNR